MRQLPYESSEIYIYKHPIDMRKSYDGLFKLVQKSSLWQGGVFLFFSKNRKRAKVPVWNKKGLMIIMQRMEHGRFADISRRKSISRNELLGIFEGSQIVSKFDQKPDFYLDKGSVNEYNALS